MACDNTNTGLGLWLCCGTLRGAEEEEEAAGVVTPWSDAHTLGLLSGTKPAVGLDTNSFDHSFLKSFQNLTMTGLETPPVARNCSCTSNTASRSAFGVFANSNASKSESDIKACTQYSLDTSCDCRMGRNHRTSESPSWEQHSTQCS